MIETESIRQIYTSRFFSGTDFDVRVTGKETMIMPENVLEWQTDIIIFASSLALWQRQLVTQLVP